MTHTDNKKEICEFCNGTYKEIRNNYEVPCRCLASPDEGMKVFIGIDWAKDEGMKDMGGDWEKVITDEFRLAIDKNHCSPLKIVKLVRSLISQTERKHKEEKDALVSALISMYEQYCPNGHIFMSAGEEASTVLEMQGYANFDEVGRMTHISDSSNS